MAKCACPTCNNEAQGRINKKLNAVQKMMLGYFCFFCVMAECKDSCNVSVR